MSTVDFQAARAANVGNNSYFAAGEIIKQQIAEPSSQAIPPLSMDQLVILNEDAKQDKFLCLTEKALKTLPEDAQRAIYNHLKEHQDEKNYISRTLKAGALGGLLGGLIGGKKWILNAALGLAGIANIIPALKNHSANKKQELDDDHITKDTLDSMKFGAIAFPIIDIIFKAIEKDPNTKLITWKNLPKLALSIISGTILMPGISSLFNSGKKAIDKFSHKITH